MTGFDYARAQATADRLLAKFGSNKGDAPRKIRIKRLIPGDGPSHNPGAPTAVEYEASAVVMPASKGTIEAFDNRYQGGSLIDEKLRYVMMSPFMTRISEEGPASIEPKSGDVLTFDSYDWTVIGSTPLSPAGVPVLFPMGVKR
jgi:hypothetical protein